MVNDKILINMPDDTFDIGQLFDSLYYFSDIFFGLFTIFQNLRYLFQSEGKIL